MREQKRREKGAMALRRVDKGGGAGTIPARARTGIYIAKVHHQQEPGPSAISRKNKRGERRG
jgi:hypothetical protein